MEALTALGINGKLLIAQIVNFLILLFILKRFLYRPIVEMLQNRKKTIAKSLEDAKIIERKLSETDTEAREKLAKAVNEAQRIIDEAKKQAASESQTTLEKAAEQAKKTVDNAKSAAENEGKIAYDKARKNLAELVTLTAEKVVSEKQDPRDIERAIEKL